MTQTMDESIVKIIDNTLSYSYACMTELKRSVCRTMHYVGLCCHIMEQTPAQVADIIGYSYGGAVKVYARWRALFEANDPSALAVAHSFTRAFPQYRARYESLACRIPAIKMAPAERVAVASAPVSLGFRYTREENKMIEAAKRSASVFMASYGNGHAPRLNGEYFSPSVQVDGCEKLEHWMPIETAVLYCGYSKSMIRQAAAEGRIARTLYTSSRSHKYYVYSVADLNKLIEERKQSIIKGQIKK